MKRLTTSFVPAAVLAAALLAVAAGPRVATAQYYAPSPDASWDWTAEAGDGPRGGREAETETESDEIACGYVFVDGAYLPPPYVISEADGAVRVNGKAVFVQPGESQGRRFGRRSSGPARRMQRTLENGEIVLAFSSEPMIIIDYNHGQYEFISSLSTAEGRDEQLEMLADLIESSEESERVLSWLRDYKAPAGLVKRADKEITFVVDDYLDEGEAGGFTLGALSYPSTMLGMILAVFAAGYLISARSHLDKKTLPGEDTSDAARAVIVLSLLGVAFSTLDLLWTMYAWQSGQMRELNPLGSQLIDSPAALMTFKIGATILSAGLLIFLRSNRKAQVVSWWLCLVYTLLAFRWLTFNSMFME